MTRDHALLGASIGVMAIVITVGAMGSAALAVPAPQEEQTFRANAQYSGAGPSGQTTVIISISRWSSDEERNELATVLVEEGSNALADALNDQEEVGFIRFPGMQTRFPSVRLRYAREFRQGDQRVIILGTDRALGWVETMRQPVRTRDARISLIQLTLDADNRGDGVMMVGAELEIDSETNTLSITNVATQPVRLTNVRPS